VGFSSQTASLVSSWLLISLAEVGDLRGECCAVLHCGIWIDTYPDGKLWIGESELAPALRALEDVLLPIPIASGNFRPVLNSRLSLEF